MRYRIKIITFKDGRQKFFAQKKGWFGWLGLWSDGRADWTYFSESVTREAALNRIDLNFAGAHEKQTIEFEYITRE